MRVAFRIYLLAIGLAAFLAAGAALAGALVEFPNVSEREPKLLGYLARPSGDGPFPAVVVLHGCAGFSSGGSLQLADQLKDWGYVALMVDSLTPRGLATACGGPFIDQPGDPTPRCATCRNNPLSRRSGSPCSVIRWAAIRRFTPSIAV